MELTRVLYQRFSLSLRDVEELLAKRGTFDVVWVVWETCGSW